MTLNSRRDVIRFRYTNADTESYPAPRTYLVHRKTPHLALQ